MLILQSVIHLAPKLNYNNLNVEMLRHFARLQSKDDQVVFLHCNFCLYLCEIVFLNLSSAYSYDFRVEYAQILQSAWVKLLNIYIHKFVKKF